MTAPPDVTRPTPLPRQLQRLVDDARARWWRTSTLPDDAPAAVLARALERHELRVAYQPIVELADRRLVAVEALVRLPEPLHADLASPAKLVAVAEAAGLVSALGTEVLVHACSQLAAWRTHPHLADLQVHVNVSPLQLRDELFIELVERTLAITELPPNALVIEVTETAAFDEDGAAEATLTTLSALDIEVSIDDFGTGFASLDLLASTPARSLKLDRSFVASIAELSAIPRGRALVVQAAIGLGRALGLRVVAEGIETEAQARTLIAWGCLYGQGYLYALPALAEDLGLEVPPPPADRRPPVWDRSPELSSDATDLALAMAAVASTANPEPGTVRADAQELAQILADVCGLDRGQADTAIVLATIADAPQRFTDVINARTGVAAAAELARVLASRGDLTAGAATGSIAAAARQIAVARREGLTLRQALAFAAPEHDPMVEQSVAGWWERTSPSPSPLRDLPGLERRLRSRDDATRRLRALSALTHAIGGAGTLEDVLHVTAEQALSALGASWLSIGRLDHELGQIRAMANVGELPPGREERPTNETYPLTDLPLLVQRLLDRAVHLGTADQDAIASGELRVLGRPDNGSSATVPIVIDNVTWGGVHVTTAAGAPPFTAADTPFLTAIASVVSLAIRRFQHVDNLTRMVGEDPLTRIANRRALEDRLALALASDREGAEVGLLMVDVDDLNRLNASHGQAEGDRVLVRVADVVSRAALTRAGAFSARLGGDEFCIMLDLDGDESGAAELLQSIRQRLADGPSPQPTVSAGFAAVPAGTVSVTELLRRADAAQYRAKRTGLTLATYDPAAPMPPPKASGPGAPVNGSGSRPGAAPEVGPTAPGRATTAALRRWGATLDGASPHDQLEGLGEAAGALLDLNRWVVSEHRCGEAMLTTSNINVRRRRPHGPEFLPSLDETFAVADYPTTATALREQSGFSVHIDDAAADRQERALLRHYGQCYVVAITATDGDRHLLLELYGDEQSTLLSEARPVVEALATRTLLRPVTCPPSRPQH